MMEKKSRFSLWLALLLMAALLTALTAAQADDGLAWMDELCPADEDGVHSIAWDDVPGDCTHDSISTVYCSKCGKSHTERDPAPGHQWDEGKVTKEATCTEAGERTYTCTRLIVNMWCGATRTESIPALGHDPETIPGKAATCTEAGLTDGSRCRRCGATLNAQETIPAAGHAWDGGTVTKAATETEEGVKTYTCTRCGATRTEAVPKLDPVAPPPAAHEHSWSGWMTDEKVHATCVTKEREYRICSSCGETEYRYGSYGGHDWGEWHVTKAPTATEPGTEERVCKLEASHRQEREIPATGEPEATGTLIVTKIAGDTKQPLAGAHFRLDGPDVVDEWTSTTEPHTVEGLSVNEIYTLFEVSAPEGYKTADSITFRVTGTDPLPLTVVDEKDGIHPKLYLTASWAPDEGAGKAYVGAEVEYTMTSINLGDCPLKWSCHSSRVISAVGPGGPVGEREDVWLDPNQSVSWTVRDKVRQTDVDQLKFVADWTSSANYTDADGQEHEVTSIPCVVKIRLTYPDGEEPEEKKPSIMLNWDYDWPAKDVYQPEDHVYAFSTVTNTGNVPLQVFIHRKIDGVEEYDWPHTFFYPGMSISKIQNGCVTGGVQAWVTPGSGTEELLGVIRFSYYAVGYDPETGEELCRSETIYRDWKVAKPGPVPWPIPSMTNMTAEIRVSPGYESSDPAGYQLGEEWGIHLKTQSTGKEAIPAYAIHVYDPYDGFTENWYNHDFMPGETIIGTNGGWDLSAITEEDVARGYIYLPPVEFTWNDPESGEAMTVKSNELTLKVISKAGLLLQKTLANSPGPQGYYQSGETIEWKLTVTNTGKEPVRNVTVTDQGVTVGTFREIAAGETVTCSVPPYVVTEYDTFAGKVSNYATATGEDLQGTVHTWNSNTAVAPTNQFTGPLVTEEGKEGTSLGEPSDPMGLVCGQKVGAFVFKEETGGPLNGSYYEQEEEICFTITVKNTGEVPLENVQVMDSLSGFTPVGTAASIAPGAEVPFTFTHKVIQADIDAGWVINSATVTYTFDGGKPGTPAQSNQVTVKAGDMNGGESIIDGGHFTPVLPTTPGGDPLAPVTKPDGTPVTGPDGTPIVAPPGTVPVLNPDGTVATTLAGDPVLMLPDGTYCIIGPDGTPIKTDQDGNPIYDGTVFGWNGGPQSCELRLNGLGENEARYTLHACSEHIAAAAAAEAAGLAGDWAEAESIWRGEVEKMYELFLEAADDEGKAALVQEHAAFLAYADAWQALAGDEAATYLMRVKCAKMCCMIHTLPEALPNSIIGAIRMNGGEAHETTLREISALKCSDSEVTELYAGAAARTLSDIRNMLDAAKSYNFSDVFDRGQRNWQIALDNTVNIAYKAADKETRKLIIAWRTALDTLYSAEKPLMEMLYPDNDTAAYEELMNLYKDAAFDAYMMK